VKQTAAQLLLGVHLRELGIETVPEYAFALGRKFRFDLANRELRLAFECNGHFAGRHGSGWSNDAEKMNLAQMLGWRVLVFTNQQVLRGKAKAFVEEWFVSPNSAMPNSR